ncbi:hypothetical protein PIB30_036211 [Stylosanthes scabra]|uniref:Uncharacterized protein n=1 Tax=Stylosanthes scabra TaxID=79078 RepID=A0ABU6TF79_9FABA|nr:hypothetical protein [Stylosanthes scabra]
MLGGRARKRAMGLQNLGAIINGINALPAHLWNGSNDSTRNRKTNHPGISLRPERYNKRIKKRDVEVGDLVLRQADIGGKNAA